MAHKKTETNLSIDQEVTLVDGVQGTIRYIGKVQGRTGQLKKGIWVGLELDKEFKDKGKNNGIVNGQKYFTCQPECGLFVRPNRIRMELTSLTYIDLFIRTLFPTFITFLDNKTLCNLLETTGMRYNIFDFDYVRNRFFDGIQERYDALNEFCILNKLLPPYISYGVKFCILNITNMNDLRSADDKLFESKVCVALTLLITQFAYYSRANLDETLTGIDGGLEEVENEITLKQKHLSICEKSVHSDAFCIVGRYGWRTVNGWIREYDTRDFKKIFSNHANIKNNVFNKKKMKPKYYKAFKKFMLEPMMRQVVNKWIVIRARGEHINTWERRVDQWSFIFGMASNNRIIFLGATIKQRLDDYD